MFTHFVDNIFCFSGKTFLSLHKQPSITTTIYSEKMRKEELRLRLQIELDMLKILLTETRDQETLDLLLDRFNEVKRVLAAIEKDIDNDKNSAI